MKYICGENSLHSHDFKWIPTGFNPSKRYKIEINFYGVIQLSDCSQSQPFNEFRKILNSKQGFKVCAVIFGLFHPTLRGLKKFELFWRQGFSSFFVLQKLNFIPPGSHKCFILLRVVQTFCNLYRCYVNLQAYVYKYICLYKDTFNDTHILFVQSLF